MDFTRVGFLLTYFYPKGLPLLTNKARPITHSVTHYDYNTKQ